MTVSSQRARFNVLSNGEVSCPRKGAPFATIISVTTCKTLHDRSPEGCAAHKCQSYMNAEAEVASIAKALEVPSRTRQPRSEGRNAKPADRVGGTISS